MDLKKSLEDDRASVPLSSLRLLVPPLKLFSAAMWQLAKQKDVMNYEKLQEFVLMVTEAVPGLINNSHRAQLILGLRARFILELCKDSYHRAVDPRVIQSYLNRLPICSKINDQNAELKTAESTFIALVQSLLKDPAERAYFFQEVFPVEYGSQYDAALHMLLWEFLSELEKLLPVPDLKQTAAWLGSAPSFVVECVQCEELTEVFEHYKSVGLLKVQNRTSTTATCIVSALSIPPSHKTPSSVGLHSLHNYANIVNTETAGADLYNVTVYSDIDVSEMEINETADAQVHTSFYEEEIMVSSDTSDTKATSLKTQKTSEIEPTENLLVTLKTFESNKQSVFSSTPTDSNILITKEDVRSECRNDALSQTGKSEGSTVEENLERVILQTSDIESSCSVQHSGASKESHQARENLLSEEILFNSVECRSLHQGEIPIRKKNCELKTVMQEEITEQKMKDRSGTSSVIAVNGFEEGESKEMTSIIFTCSQCPFYSSDLNSPSHFHMQTVHRDSYPGPSHTFTPSPLSTDDIFTSIKLFPKGNAEQSNVSTSRQSSLSVSSSQSRPKDYTCKTCGKTFTRTSDVRRHQLTHTGERPFHCSKCDRTFQHSWDLAKHESKHHGIAISFSCQICKSSFPNLRTLTVHHKKSHVEVCQLPQICSICSQSFATSSELIEHRKFHVTSKRYICQQCGEGFDTLLARSQHRQMHQVKRQFKCPLCEKSYTRRSDVKRHMSNHTGERPHQCSQCHKSFSLRFMLIKHLRVHTGERPFQCSHCFKRFTLVSVLARHERMHTGEKPFLCSQCGKSFLSQGELSKHYRSHTDERPYSCPQCDKTFKSKKSQQEHIISHSGARPHSCTYCGKGFTKPYALTRHNLIHTGERPFPCGHCEKSFLTLSEAQLHQRVHTGERPYSCQLCDLKFKSSSELSRHKRSHSELNPLKLPCEHCLKTFTSKVKLRKHMELHENKNNLPVLNSNQKKCG